MKKKTTVTATVAAPVAAKAKHSSTPQTRRLQQLATLWNAMSGPEQSSWNVLAGQVANPNAITMPTKVGAYAHFVQNAITQINAGGTPLTTAPPAPVPAPSLPAVTLSAFYGSGGLGLSLTSPADYAGRVILYASKPRLTGSSNYGKGAFKVIGALPSLTVGVNVIAPQYLSKYRVPGPGYQISVKLVGVTPGGFRTSEMLISGLVLGAAAEASDTGEDTSENASDTGDMEMQKAA